MSREKEIIRHWVGVYSGILYKTYSDTVVACTKASLVGCDIAAFAVRGISEEEYDRLGTGLKRTNKSDTLENNELNTLIDLLKEINDNLCELRKDIMELHQTVRNK